jgi:Bacterial aa3 type cytochrome c oxidase subunit IV
MAEHADIEYATAKGNDYPTHEATYEDFVHIIAVSVTFIISVLIGLAIIGVVGNLYVGIPLIIIAAIVTVTGIFSRSATPGYVMVVISLIALAVTAAH